MGTTLLDGRTGAIAKQLDPSSSYGVRLSSFADIDGDGKLDVVDGQHAWRTDGTVIWDLSSGPDDRREPDPYDLQHHRHALGDRRRGQRRPGGHRRRFKRLRRNV